MDAPSLDRDGEAVRASIDELRVRAPSIPWNRVIGMRNIIVHTYFGVDLEEVWVAIARDVPMLKTAVLNLLRQIEPTSPDERPPL
jgi:uncharacterized protein with HEPN domain